jgi:hypothetical protein
MADGKVQVPLQPHRCSTGALVACKASHAWPAVVSSCAFFAIACAITVAVWASSSRDLAAQAGRDVDADATLLSLRLATSIADTVRGMSFMAAAIATLAPVFSPRQYRQVRFRRTRGGGGD